MVMSRSDSDQGNDEAEMVADLSGEILKTL